MRNNQSETLDERTMDSKEPGIPSGGDLPDWLKRDLAMQNSSRMSLADKFILGGIVLAVVLFWAFIVLVVWVNIWSK